MKKRNLLIVVALLLITAVITVIYLPKRTAAQAGTLIITYDGKNISVDPFNAPAVDVQGTTLNGKGEEKQISETGVTVLSVLGLADISAEDFTTAKVVASDEYSAEISATEISTDGVAYLVSAADDNGATKIKLIVFGDSNSKRQIKDVVRIELAK
ncbi:hypothetical protein [Butyrivibrio sp. FC2001]|uniref:hypothetical protein n=1 Tax=Butyrivibrio sp. FC2001 TaxID=1280671 RepID=UPI000417443C|nr:hypothetical protein [Butyrivibrio sp. FC2001]